MLPFCIVLDEPGFGIGMGFYPAQILVTVIIAGTSFLLSHLWVYR